MSALPNPDPDANLDAIPDNPSATTVTSPDSTETRAAHSHHPEALRLRAAALYSEGLRSPAIAQQLGVPERTVRAWLADARADFYAQHADCASVGEYLAVAIERKLAIAAAAWQSYHNAVACEQLALDYYHAGLNRTARLKNIDDELPPPPPRPSTAPARFLSVALAAQREASRIGGCYDRPSARAATSLTAAVSAPLMKSASSAATSRSTAGSSSSNPASATLRGLDPVDRPAWTSFMARLGLSADYAGPDDLDMVYRPAWESVRRIYRASPPTTTASSSAPATVPPAPPSTIPAETATAPAAAATPDTDRRTSARTATAPTDGDTASASPIPAKTATAPTAPPSADSASTPASANSAESATADSPPDTAITEPRASEPPHPWQHMM